MTQAIFSQMRDPDIFRFNGQAKLYVRRAFPYTVTSVEKKRSQETLIVSR